MKTLILILTFVLLLSIACKKEEEEPQPELEPTMEIKEPRQHDVKRIFGIELYNQVLDTVNTKELYKFYNITEEKYSNSLDFTIELAYVYQEFSNNAINQILGSAKNYYVRTEHGLPSTNETSIDFFIIDDGHSSLIYDTIQYSESITAIFKNKAKISYVIGENDAIQSDKFGWDKDKILGFKLTNGKQGLIKLKKAPTGSKDDKGNVFIGKIVFDIKMEK